MFLLRRAAICVTACGLATIVWGARPAVAQVLRDRPLTLFGERVVLGAEASASIGPEDTPGYFNYTDYEDSSLRMLRLSLSGQVTMGRRLAILGQLTTENLRSVRAQALYLRVRPWRERAFDVQAGLIPPTFGSFGRRGYGSDNFLIGYPLAYQYLTTIRADSVPATSDELLRVRGRGWRVAYRVGSVAPDTGLPAVTSFRWDAGVQARVTFRSLEVAGAVTAGTLSKPLIDDDNRGKQVSARVAFRPSPAVTLGVSVAQGEWLARSVREALPPETTSGQRYDQRAVGFDAELSRGRWVVRSEGVFTSWRVPAVAAPRLEDRLGARSVMLEGRYRLRPALYVAARGGWMGFSSIVGTLHRGAPTPWDAPVTRVEAGGGFYLRRNLIAKGVYQHNWRPGTSTSSGGFPAAQLLYWF